MTILSIQFLQLGVVPSANPNNALPAASQTPSLIFIATNDTNATVTTAGYLNALQQSTTDNFVFNNTQLALVYTTDDGVNWYQISIAAGTGIITLVAIVSPGDVLLPVIDHHIAAFNGVTGQIADLTGTLIAKGSLQAGTATSQGSLIAFGAANAGANDKLTISYVTSTANRGLTITNAAMGQATTLTIANPGVAASGFILNDNAVGQTIATGFLALTSGLLNVGSVGHAGTMGLVPTTAANGQFILSATDAGANFNTTVTNGLMGQSSVITIPDPGAATANFLLDAGAGNSVTDCSHLIPIQNMMLAAAGGVWTLTRAAQGDWGQVHTVAADTSILGFDITDMLRVAANHGFELTSFDVSYSIGILALVAHSITLNKIVYSNNVANAVTTPAITSTLATATQAQPYLTNSTVNAPVFANPAAGTAVKYVLELTVNAAATSTYTLNGINLRFTRTIK